MKVWETIESIRFCKSEQELFNFVLTALQQVGYDNCVISTYSDTAPRLIAHKTPRGWEDRYFEKRYWNVDAAYHRQQWDWEPHIWDEIVPLSATEATKSFMGEAREFGLNDGVTVSAHLAGRKMNFAISSKTPQTTGDLKQVVNVGFMLSAAFASQLGKLIHQKPEHHLTPREHEVVRWVAAGKTNDEIGMILGIGARTVEEYLRRISIRFGINGRFQIVTFAIVNGLIEIP